MFRVMNLADRAIAVYLKIVPNGRHVLTLKANGAEDFAAEAVIEPQKRASIGAGFLGVAIDRENCKIDNRCGAWYEFAVIDGEEHLLVLSVSETGYTQ